MEAAALIQVSVAGMNLLLKSIEAANQGDLQAAQLLLSEAREHFTKSVAAWDAAGQG
jgi:hypothetical protein